jgi:hypothetical protein
MFRIKILIQNNDHKTRSDELQIGDIILSINGIKTLGLKHEEIIDLIKNAREKLFLEYEYNLPPWRNNKE